MFLRRQCYQRNIFKQYTLPVPVISIGNLMMGGTGKTPMVRFLAQYLLDQGYRPAIISRGYGGTANQTYNIVSNGQEILLTPEQAGDEPYMLAASLTSQSQGVPVITGRKRIIPARYALQNFQVDCLLLDDGFQHIALHRDINIVLFDSTTLAGNSRVFPGGPLREPVSVLRHADCFVMSGTTDSNKKRAESFANMLRKRLPDKEVFMVQRGRLTFTTLTGKKTKLCNKTPIFAFCGIANPERFRQDLTKQGFIVKDFLALQDHKRYDNKTFTLIKQRSQSSGAKIIVTTEKDAVKLKGIYNTPFGESIVVASFEIMPAQFIPFFEHKLKKIKTNSTQ